MNNNKEETVEDSLNNNREETMKHSLDNNIEEIVEDSLNNNEEGERPLLDKMKRLNMNLNLIIFQKK